MKRRHLISIAAVAAALAVLAGCGGSDNTTTIGTVSGGSNAEDVKVIETWVDALRAGDVDKAAASFALPSVVQNGTRPIELKTREEVVLFNESLPCGAKLVSASTEGEVTTAAFELTERPGGHCGAGTGQTASTAFVIEDGLIVHWSRVPGPDDGPAPEGTLS